jgi:replicative DNA helicase
MPPKRRNSAGTNLSGTIYKAPAGITGFDEITGGGLPHGRTTLLAGGPGSGKTIFALQFLTHGARYCREPGIFVAVVIQPFASQCSPLFGHGHSIFKLPHPFAVPARAVPL